MADAIAFPIPKACAYLGINRDEMDRLIAAGKIRTFFLGGNQRVAKVELNRYMRENAKDAEGRRTIMEGGE